MLTNLDAYVDWMSALFPYSPGWRIFFLLSESPRFLNSFVEISGLATEIVTKQLDLLRSLDVVNADGDADNPLYRLNEDRLRRALDDLQAVPGDGRSVTDQRAPLFQLPSADGSEIALVDCLAQGPTIVWFSRGLSCSFCRRHRVQLTLNYPAFRHLGAEILEVTPTPVNLATFYLSRYQLAFPYLCDPRGVVAEMYGVKRGTYEPLMALRVMLADTLGSKEIMREYLHGPKLEPTAEEMANGGSNEGFFIVDWSGTVRLATVGPHIGVPSNDEVERQLRRIIG